MLQFLFTLFLQGDLPLSQGLVCTKLLFIKNICLFDRYEEK